MEKQIRNARKRISPSNAAKRRRLSPLSQQSNVASGKTLPALQNGAQAIERWPETFGTEKKTFEIVNDKPMFYIVMPCSVDDKKGPTPLYLVKENEFGGAESGVWQCQECTRIFHTRRSWEKHKGIRWITGPEIKVCV